SSVFVKIRYAHVLKEREVIQLAIFHLSMTIAKREGGKRSLIAMASYRSGEKLYSELYEKTNLYNHRTVKPEAFILKPDYVPNEF
ncbi:hypothetical protein ACM6QN_15085, partial [Enterococcus faecium]